MSLLKILSGTHYVLKEYTKFPIFWGYNEARAMEVKAEWWSVSF